MTEFYPGSKHQVRTFTIPDPEPEPFYLSDPMIKKISGIDTEFYTTGQLAAALNRKAGTLRLWERNGTIPKPTYTLQKDNRYAKRRLYTREQVEGLRQIAMEEGVLSDISCHITKTNFAARAMQLFKETS